MEGAEMALCAFLFFLGGAQKLYSWWSVALLWREAMVSLFCFASSGHLLEFELLCRVPGLSGNPEPQSGVQSFFFSLYFPPLLFSLQSLSLILCLFFHVFGNQIVL